MAGRSQPNFVRQFTAINSSTLSAVVESPSSIPNLVDNDDMDPPSFPYRSSGTVEARLAAEKDAKLRKLHMLGRFKSIDLEPIITAVGNDNVKFSVWAKQAVAEQKVLEDELKVKRNTLVLTIVDLRKLEKNKIQLSLGLYMDAKDTLNRELEIVVDQIRGIAKHLGIRFAEADVMIMGLAAEPRWIDVSAGRIELELYDLIPEMRPYGMKVPTTEQEAKAGPSKINDIPGTPTYTGLEFTLSKAEQTALKIKYEAAKNHGEFRNHEDGVYAELQRFIPIPLIPEWFYHIEQHGTIRFNTTGTFARFKELSNRISRLEIAAEGQIELGEAGASSGTTTTTTTKKWDKEWHEPSPDWRHPHQQRSGGWWKCRTDADVCAAERECKLCHGRRPAAPSEFASTPEPSALLLLEELMRQIGKSMAAIAKEDDRAIKARMAKETHPANLSKEGIKAWHYQRLNQFDAAKEKGAAADPKGKRPATPADPTSKCHACGKPEALGGDSLKKCGGCRKVAYCTAPCQKKDWKRHKAEKCAPPTKEEVELRKQRQQKEREEMVESEAVCYEGSDRHKYIVANPRSWQAMFTTIVPRRAANASKQE